jgi:serine/threonine-protein kinase
MSPEQIKDETLAANCDIFSVGCVLYELLCGHPAFPGENEYSIIYKVTNEDPEPIENLRPGLPRLLQGILGRAFQKDPGKRYQTCQEMACDLRMVLRVLMDQAPEKIETIVDFVHSVSFFRNFTQDQVRHLVAVGTILKAEKGQIILTEGEIDDTFYVLLGGKASICKGGRCIAAVRAGEVFGEMAYIAGQARIASVVAETDCMLMRISATLLDKAPKGIQLLFFKNFATTLVQRLSKKTDADQGV